MASQGTQRVLVAPLASRVIECAGRQGITTMPMQQRYEEVADDLAAKIKSREYPPGTLLPSRAQMREIYKISDTVSDKAFRILRERGMTETLAGVGVYVRKD